MKKFIVVDEPRETGDMWTAVYDDAFEAAEAAKQAWHRLTAAEQRRRHVFSGIVDETMLADDAVDEDGNVDWRCWDSVDAYDGAFDSAKEE